VEATEFGAKGEGGLLLFVKVNKAESTLATISAKDGRRVR
jgi:hypothetical protein